MSETAKNILPYINRRKYPFVRFILPFIAGILVQQYVAFAAHWWLLIPVLIFLYFRVFAAAQKSFGVVAVAALFALGAQYAYQYNTIPGAHFQYQLTDKKQQLLVQVVDMPKVKTGISVEVKVLAVADSTEQAVSAQGHLLLSLEQDSTLAETIRYGDQLEITAYVNDIKTPRNPHAFDFARFRALQRIYHQAYVANEHWEIVKREQGHPLYSYIYSVRSKLLSILQAQLSADRNFGVAAALTLGYRTALDDEVSTAFANSGAIHVLAVSGLHVGIIAGLLSLCLQWFSHYHTYQKWIKFTVVVGGIWFFALLTGNAPSVQRASIMFTIIAAGHYFVRQGNIYNSLSVAAFISLMLDPNVLFTVGFQLSYTAVLGIVLLQPHIAKLWSVKHPVLKFIWNLLAVSFAAQLAVAPISIYYFHQFPVYFWLSSLVAIPAASVILMLTVALFLSTPLPILANGIGWLLDTVLTVLNTFIFGVNQLPFSLQDNLWLSFGELLLLYAALISFMVSRSANRRFWLYATAVFLLATCVSIAGRQIKQQYQDKVVIYDVPNATILDYFEGQNVYTFQSEEIEETIIQYNVTPNRIAKSVVVKEVFSILNAVDWKDDRVAVDLPIVQLGEQRLCILSSNTLPITKQAVDYLLLTNGVDLPLATIIERINARHIIVDASNEWRVIREWRKAAEELKVELYVTKAKGAFVEEW
ncbi:MAG: ComEC/Rec2 family competence protein [Bacteroidota bacterium]